MVRRKGAGRAQRAFGLGVCPAGHGMMYWMGDSERYFCPSQEHDGAPATRSSEQRDPSKAWWTTEELEALKEGGKREA